jgi:HAD superfamily hydrolase (TIGR01450 family)
VAPPIPEDIQPGDLDKEIGVELRTLPRGLADKVARHLVAAGRLVDEDPAEALAHAVAARRLASRISAVREAVGLAAYRAGEWQTAITELRTYHRMSGQQAHLAVLADCERALGRPTRAIDLYRTAPVDSLPPAEAIELLIVAAGARADLGQHDAAVAMLQVPGLSADEPSASAARLRYAYADALLAAGRRVEAREWFARAAAADEDTETDAAQRLLDLDGVVLDEADLDEVQLDEVQLDEVQLDEDLEPEAGPQAEAEAEPGAPATAGRRLIDAYDLVILDLDGVVYLGAEPILGAAEVVDRLRQEGLPVVFATNNASRSQDQIAALLVGLGIEATAGEVLTSGAVAADVLADRLAPGSVVLVVGAEALAGEVRRVGLQPVRSADDKPAAVVQGYAPQVGWAELAEAQVAVRSGALWVVTNPDTTLPSLRGLLPGNGALVAALQTALEREPDLVVGKPEPALFATAAQRFGATAPLVVGDRLDTDIEGANRAGMDSLLVLTGVSDQAQARTAARGRRPTFLGADLAALFAPAARL